MLAREHGLCCTMSKADRYAANADLRETIEASFKVFALCLLTSEPAILPLGRKCCSSGSAGILHEVDAARKLKLRRRRTCIRAIHK